MVTEYRWAEGQYDRLPALAADLVDRKVDVIVTLGGTPPALAAKNATSTIPIVFTGAGDPVGLGLVASLARPGGNVTGFSNFSIELMPKRLEFLCELVPRATMIALLANPDNERTEQQIRLTQEAARAKAIQLSSRRGQLVALASRYAVPAIYELGGFAAAGGLISYGPDPEALARQAGVYAGRILKGAKPADLPVQQPTTFQLVVNLNTAKALGITVPPSILARADEVIQ